MLPTILPHEVGGCPPFVKLLAGQVSSSYPLRALARLGTLLLDHKVLVSCVGLLLLEVELMNAEINRSLRRRLAARLMVNTCN